MSITVNIDSYITISEAQEYLDYEFNTDSWDNASESDKEKALKQATKKIDGQYLLYCKYDEDQVLQFPRNIYIARGYNDVYGEVPKQVKEAQALEALNILNVVTNANGQDIAINDAKKGIVSRSVKSASVTYDKDQLERLRNLQKALCDDAVNLLTPWIQTTFDRC